MIIQAHGGHKKALPGEMLIGYFSDAHFHEFIVWETKRLGPVQKQGSQKRKYPVFIQRNEAIDKGWTIGSF